MSRLMILILLVFGPVLMNGLSGCEDCSSTPFRFGIEDYQAYPRQLDKQPYKQFLTDTATAAEALSYQEAELVLIGKEIRYAFGQHAGTTSNAIACSPAEIAQDRIKSLVITSNQAYSAEFPSGSDLAPLLTIGSGPNDQKPLSEFLASDNPAAQSFLSVRFVKGPGSLATHQFSGVVDLGKGQPIRFVTKPVTLKPQL